jgi:hypothetical protein
MGLAVAQWRFYSVLVVYEMAKTHDLPWIAYTKTVCLMMATMSDFHLIVSSYA